MTTLNTIIEEEKGKYKKRFQEKNILSDGSSTEYIHLKGSALDKDFQDFLTTAMQRAYEAGEREADAKWEREVQKEIQCVQAILVDIGSGAFSRDQMIHAENVINRAIEIRNEVNTILDTILSKIRS